MQVRQKKWRVGSALEQAGQAGGPLCCPCEAIVAQLGPACRGESEGEDRGDESSSPHILLLVLVTLAHDGRSSQCATGCALAPGDRSRPAGHRPLLPGARRRGRLRQEVRPLHPAPSSPRTRADSRNAAWDPLASSRASAPATRAAPSSSRSSSSPTRPSRSSRSTVASKVRLRPSASTYSHSVADPPPLPPTAERDALVECPNVLAYGRALETERAGYLMRQWVASNLYDRIRCVLSFPRAGWSRLTPTTSLTLPHLRLAALGPSSPRSRSAGSPFSS